MIKTINAARPQPHNVAYIESRNNKTYLLITYRTKGYEAYRQHTLHNCDLDAGLIETTPVITLETPLKNFKRYQPYFSDVTDLLSFAVASGDLWKVGDLGKAKYKNKKHLTMSFGDLDYIYRAFIKEYKSATFDTQTFAAPDDAGIVIMGRIK